MHAAWPSAGPSQHIDDLAQVVDGTSDYIFDTLTPAATHLSEALERRGFQISDKTATLELDESLPAFVIAVCPSRLLREIATSGQTPQEVVVAVSGCNACATRMLASGSSRTLISARPIPKRRNSTNLGP